MTPDMAVTVLNEHLKSRRGEPAVRFCDCDLSKAVQIACQALNALDQQARVMDEARTLLMASRKKLETNDE